MTNHINNYDNYGQVFGVEQCRLWWVESLGAESVPGSQPLGTSRLKKGKSKQTLKLHPGEHAYPKFTVRLTSHQNEFGICFSRTYLLQLRLQYAVISFCVVDTVVCSYLWVGCKPPDAWSAALCSMLEVQRRGVRGRSDFQTLKGRSFRRRDSTKDLDIPT